VVNGEGVRDIAHNMEWISQFSEVIICMDMDEAGKRANKEISQLIGPHAKVMSFSENDPNDMLLAGKHKEFVDSFFKAKPYVPDGILTVEDVFDKAIVMPEWGRLYPWPTLNKLTYGRRDGEGMYVGAGVKAGKTEWKHQQVHYITEVEHKPVLMFNFEQSPEHTAKMVAGKLANKQFHVPDGDFTQEELIQAVESVKGKIVMFDASYSDVGKTNLWDRMKPVIRHAVLVQGVKDIFIDPITQLTDGMTASETEQELRRFSNEIQGMAQDLGFFYYCFCHLKEPPQGKTHEEGGGVKVAQFRGSRAMAEKTKYMLGIIRNQYSEDETERNTSVFHLLLNSGFGKSGRFDVVYDVDTGSYLEPEEIESF
jgi:twinkle protein